MFFDNTSPETKVQADVTISGHTWQNKMVHVIRSDGRLQRGVCKDLIIRQHGIFFKVVFVGKRASKKCKYVTPCMLLAVHTFWKDSSVVSDDDETSTNSPLTPETYTLPKFFVEKSETEKIAVSQREALASISKELWGLSGMLYACT